MAFRNIIGKFGVEIPRSFICKHNMILAHRNLSVTPHGHLLAAHSEMVARLCAGFAAEIGSEYAGVGYLLGLLHDFGKL